MLSPMFHLCQMSSRRLTLTDTSLMWKLRLGKESCTSIFRLSLSAFRVGTCLVLDLKRPRVGLTSTLSRWMLQVVFSWPRPLNVISKVIYLSPRHAGGAINLNCHFSIPSYPVQMLAVLKLYCSHSSYYRSMLLPVMAVFRLWRDDCPPSRAVSFIL